MKASLLCSTGESFFNILKRLSHYILMPDIFPHPHQNIPQQILSSPFIYEESVLIFHRKANSPDPIFDSAFRNYFFTCLLQVFSKFRILTEFFAYTFINNFFSYLYPDLIIKMLYRSA